MEILRIGIGSTEIFNIPGAHRLIDIGPDFSYVGEVETFPRCIVLCNPEQGIALVPRQICQCTVHFNVRHERIVFRRAHLVGITEEQRNAKSVVGWKKLAKFGIGDEVEIKIFTSAALTYALVDRSEPDGTLASGYADVGKISQLRIHASGSRPSAFVVEVSKA